MIAAMPDYAHADMIAALAATPSWLRDAVSALGPESSEARPVDAWGAGDVIRHVRAADAIITGRVWHIAVRHGAPLPAFDERAWARLYAASGVPLTEQMQHFALRRAELVAVLRSLASKDWARTGEHESAGTMSVADLCRNVVTHEAEHRAQLDAIVAAARPGADSS